MPAVREKPMLFSASMVRALLAEKKTQTRRLVKPPAGVPSVWIFGHSDRERARVRCPYGVAGDRLWVKETWTPRHGHGEGGTDCGCECGAVRVEYLADGGWKEFAPEAVADGWKMPKAASRGRNVTPLFMPRWASRITLEVTGVRVERVQDISEEDAKAEGITEIGGRFTFNEGLHQSRTARDSYAALWEIINGTESWDANPFVWCVSFRVLA